MGGRTPVGYSYLGMAQLLTAAPAPLPLKTIAPAFVGHNHYLDCTYPGGAFPLAFSAWWTCFLAQGTAARTQRFDVKSRFTGYARPIQERCWTLPLRGLALPRDLAAFASYFHDWLTHYTRDAYRQALEPNVGAKRLVAPSLHVAGWYDTFVEGTLAAFEALHHDQSCSAPTVRRRLVIGPWRHNPWTSLTGSIDFGGQAGRSIDQEQLEWFDLTLKGEDSALSAHPAVGYFVLGDNLWRQLETWPPNGVQYTPYYLHSRGRTNSTHGDGYLSPDPPGSEWPDIFVYNPRDPISSFGGRSCRLPEIAPMGPADRRPVAARRDVLVYLTEPFDRDIEFAGPITTALWATSSTPDTDFVVTLVHVLPDGRTVNLCDGIQPARLHNSFAQQQELAPGEVARFSIRVESTALRLCFGDRMGILISSSSSPTCDRNPNRLIPPERSDWPIFNPRGRPYYTTASTRPMFPYLSSMSESVEPGHLASVR